MNLIERVMTRLDDLTDQIADNKVQIIKAIQNCPRGQKHEDQIILLKEWQDRLAGKITIIVFLCSTAGVVLVTALIDLIRWKMG